MDLAHASRLTLLGELTASITHEINQPLGAILSNAETAGILLQAKQPLLEEVHGMEAMSESAESNRWLTMRTAYDGKDNVEVAVEDSGPGIPSERLPRLFDSFFTTKPHGMGLGLSIVRSIVEAHGGRIWAENNSRGGACFRFTLPVNCKK
jgi:signal transduction histidine kinase